MSMKVPVEGQVQILTDLLGGGSLENWQLALFSSAHTPAVTDTAATYTAIECAISGYARKTLTRSVSGTTWSTPTGTGSTIDPTNHNGKSTYGSSSPSFSFTGSGSVYGYFYIGATSGKCLGAEAYATAITGVTSGASLTQPANYELGSN